jgi:hypothetical protein
MTMFAYPREPHETRHGPQGYRDYQSFKPWLRDEFSFRCVYCLWRESWCGDGDDSFSVEHLFPRSTHPDRVCDYDNLVYACCRCNSMKQNAPPVFDPSRDSWGWHLVSEPDGTLRSLTTDGDRLIAICRLNRPALVNARRRIADLIATLRDSHGEKAAALLRLYLGFPENLPLLSRLKPPRGNARPQGIMNSYYEKRQRGELPDTY